MLKADIGAMLNRFSPAVWADTEVVPYAARVSVWGRWFILLVAVFQFLYRPMFWYPDHVEYTLLPAAALALNGLVHYRLLTDRPVTWRWLLFLSVMDFALITAGLVFQAGLTSGLVLQSAIHGFMFLAYYPALALLVVVFPSLWFGLAWTTVTAVVYSVLCMTTGPGLNLDLEEEKLLLARVAMMYALVLFVSLIARFDRTTRQAALERERKLQRERIELSQEIHDTTAQTAYMIGLGIHRARELSDKSNAELIAALDATSTLSRSAMWELRRPIDAGHIFEGRQLGAVLWSHCATYEKITGVPANMSLSGTEPPLSTDTRARLFSIAHNALTNAFLHARASVVEVRLEFESDGTRLLVSDDGVGLPDDYAERGNGFKGMNDDTERMGGSLVVESRDGVGTTIACVVPYKADRRGG